MGFSIRAQKVKEVEEGERSIIAGRRTGKDAVCKNFIQSVVTE